MASSSSNVQPSNSNLYTFRWNEFQPAMASSFKRLKDEKSFFDVTVACEGKTLKAHQLVLGAFSPYFKKIFVANPSKHPLIILKDVPSKYMEQMIEFMYNGAVNVESSSFHGFLKLAEKLEVKGLNAPATSLHQAKVVKLGDGK